MDLKEEDFLNWLQDPVTVALRETLLPRWVQEQVDLWKAGSFTHPTEAGTLQQNARAVGICEICEKLIELDFITLQGELYEEHERPQAAGPGSPGPDV